MDAVTNVPPPVNEPVRQYAPATPERAAVERKIKELAGEQAEFTMTIGGKRRMGGGELIDVVQPHNHSHVLGRMGEATDEEVAAAVEAARAAAPGWQALSFDDRAAIFLKAAELLSGPWRATMNAATILGQSKSVYQAEIDAVCELIDFWRFNVAFARHLLADQPVSGPGTWNRMDYRPLDGFVLAITPFNFTSIAANLPSAPALLGNTVVWKPSPTQQMSAQVSLSVLEAAGLPPGVINMVTGRGEAVSRVALTHPELAGIHFTGSTATFQHLWSTVGNRIASYRSYPRIVGETGGKDFVVAHPSADPDVLGTALIRGAFEYQGQKCSAASRSYIPRSLWDRAGDDFVALVQSLTMGDAALERAGQRPSVRMLTGGCDDSVGYFVMPTVLECEDPTDEVFTTEYFGPILSVYVYPDSEYSSVLAQAAEVAPYALTGSIIATDRAAIAKATHALRFAAGNFYINDKPTGAIVGQQPFGGSRSSGTNDKAGSALNLTRWVSARAIKELFSPPVDYRYPHMG